ncbi:hypothetical protein NitYY0826_C0254 [Nitratiruptor sp. YY08-26]|uniref:hypothetical protein n=1 Tax=unclassified Nitratiruptor TaxID=2624044 RepID=UPI00191566D6|nr:MULTISPECIES: hypothetical protein [unclassified Nitratiruptor]BCD61408.1 hypothetical protein NitYY0813_C0253 [Nitratiruptor sp. YY08-13]BCD65342.1 hypothetical protein NitYY0826_C0254 [Nitratiruptor sp. YY08-26]
MKVADVAQYAIMTLTRQTKEQIAVSLLKKSIEQTKQMMEELVQKSLQPPKNEKGTLSLYA